MNEVYKQVLSFKRMFPGTISWRLKAHSKIVQDYLNPGEKVKYVFAAQKTDCWYDIMSTWIIAITNKRIIMGQKRLLWGHHFMAITPDMFNDIEVNMGLIWGKVYIDTIKEYVTLSKVSKKALDYIETAISEYMMEEKKKYGLKMGAK